MRTGLKLETAICASVGCLLLMMACSTIAAGEEPAAKLEQAAIDARMGKTEQGIGVLKSLLADASMATAAGYELGLVHFENNQLDEAAPILKTALAATFLGPASGKDERRQSCTLQSNETAIA